MIQDQTAPLRRVYVREPRRDDLAGWRSYGWLEAPDPSRAEEEHVAFRAELERTGAEVVVGKAEVPGDPDAIYTCDPALLTDDGAILLRPGNPGRRSEPGAARADLVAVGVEILAELVEPATAEGGDLFLARPINAARRPGIPDQRRGDRTTEDASRSSRRRRGAVRSAACSRTGGVSAPPSLLSPLAPDLAVAYPCLLPVRLVELLRDRGIRLIEVPDEEFDSMGANVLVLSPRVALALDGNPETRRRMEAAGVDVRSYRGDEISRKGGGGPTCLTRPLSRG